MNTSIEIRLVSSPLSFAEAPAEYPNKNSNNRKTESARGTMGKGKRRESLLYNAFKMAPNFLLLLFREKIGVRLGPQLNPSLLFGHESELRW